MEILKLLQSLKTEYSDNSIIRKNDTILLGPGKIPKAKHMVFPGLSYELIDEFLVSDYKHPFPTQYRDFLNHFNGANLFMFKIVSKTKGKTLEFASKNLTIFGLPRTQPFGRPADMEEPYDVRIEDLGRHKDIPDTWLKIGCYKKAFEFGDPADIFIDTGTERVFSCMRNDNNILQEWETLDACLCDIFKRVSQYGEVLITK